MPLFTDQLGRTLSLDHPPRRIISLVPSQTELLYTLGLEGEVVGITKFCIHPDQWFRNKTRIGGTKDIRPDIILSLQPDLIIANKEENDQAQVEALSAHVPVWISNVTDLPSALGMIRSVGELTGKVQSANVLADEIAHRFAALEAATTAPGPRTAYFIWHGPWMVAGGDSFIHDMLRRAGFDNIFRDQPRYPSIELETLAASGCEVVLLSSEPYPFKEKHIAAVKQVLPHALTRLVDGQIFSWYGSHLLHTPAYLQELYEGLTRNNDI